MRRSLLKDRDPTGYTTSDRCTPNDFHLNLIKFNLSSFLSQGISVINIKSPSCQ